MRRTLFVATILAGALPLISAHAGPRPLAGPINGDKTLTVREANEAPRHEDRHADRHRHAENVAPGTTTLAREAGEAPRGKDGPHDRGRGGHAWNTVPNGFDPSGIVLAREAGERPRGEGHP